MSRKHLWLAVLVTAAVVRVFMLDAYPLRDTTEARYSEVARLMVVSDDWITPYIEPDVPFWAKPPLSFWLTAGSFKLLGINEFAARLPAFLLTLLTAILMFRAGRKHFSDEAAVASCAILFTSAVGFIAAGAVMTDAALLLSTTLSLLSFWMATNEPRSPWRYFFFVGLGLGLLAKGPVAVVLVGIPILFWTLFYKNLIWLWRALPWVTGSLLALAIAGPWYWLAELRTPGFLEYYIIGEHWLRFVESGWQGDLYGNAHSEARGTIWVYGFVAALPWSLLALFAAGGAVRRRPVLRSLTPLQGYLLLWMLAPLLFFTFSGNILEAYVLPGLPAFALLLGGWLTDRSRAYAHLGWFIPALILGALVTGELERLNYKSQRDLVNLHYSRPAPSDLYYFPRAPHSARFYSAGQVRTLQSESDLIQYLATPGEGYVAMSKKAANELSVDLTPCLQTGEVINGYLLLRKSDACK